MDCFMAKSVAFLTLVFVVISMEEKILVILIGDGNHTAAIFHDLTQVIYLRGVGTGG